MLQGVQTADIAVAAARAALAGVIQLCAELREIGLPTEAAERVKQAMVHDLHRAEIPVLAQGEIQKTIVQVWNRAHQ